MARIRTVKPDLFQHEALYEAEVESGLPLRLAFIGLFTQCDREGRFRWRPRMLQLGILPYDSLGPDKAQPRHDQGFFESILDALVRKGFVVRYEVDGKVFGFIPSWSDHQRPHPREQTSTIPAPSKTGHNQGHTKAQPKAVGGTTKDIPYPQGRERSLGREGEGNRSIPPYPPYPNREPEASPQLDQPRERDSDIQSLLDLWAVSVKPWTIDDSTSAASDSLRFLLRKTPPDFLERAVTNFAAFLDAEAREPRYRPNMAKWLREKSWKTYGDPAYEPPKVMSDVDQVQAYVDRLDEQTRKRAEQKAEQAEQGAGS